MKMNAQYEDRVELFRAVPIEEMVGNRELHNGASFLGEVLYLIYASAP